MSVASSVYSDAPDCHPRGAICKREQIVCRSSTKKIRSMFGGKFFGDRKFPLGSQIRTTFPFLPLIHIRAGLHPA